MGVTDPVTGNYEFKIVNTPSFPVSMNGNKVYGSNEVTIAFSPAANVPVEEKLLKNLAAAISIAELPDGTLNIGLDKIVIDKKGRIVYSDFSGIKMTTKADGEKRSLAVNDALLFSNITLPIASHQKKPVVYWQKVAVGNYIVTVRNHKMIVKKIS